jgi:hypothetical protein
MMRASVWLTAIGACRPDILGACTAAWDKGARDGEFVRVAKDLFAACPSDSIDYAVMERITGVAASADLPAGVVLNLDGWCTGTPREPRKGEVTVVAEDSRRAIVTRTCALQADLPEPANLRLVGTPSVVNPAGGSLPLVLQLDRAYPLPISGLLSLESQPDTGVADDRVNQADPAVVFAANGRRQLPFSLPAGQLRFAATITGPGSVAGYLMARVERLEIAGQAQVATPGAARVTVLRTAPGL